MAIITISRGSYSLGKKVAEKLAAELGYTCISREILLRASEQFNIPEIKLIRAIHDSPSILERFTHGKERYVAYIRAALLEHVQKGNVVYHGLAGHFLLQGVPHVLKVRILADIEERVAEEMRREDISAAKARELIKKDDEERRKWSLHLYGADPWDPGLYDLVIHLKPMTVDDAVRLISFTVKLPGFHSTPQSQQVIDHLALTARVETALMEEFPAAEVTTRKETVLVNLEGYPVPEREAATSRIRQIAWKAAGILVEVGYEKIEKSAAEASLSDMPYTANEFIVQAYEGDLKSVNFFLNSGMTPNVKTGEGETPLMAAAENGHTEIVSTLLARGADVNAISSRGLTPLFLAAQNGHTEIVYALLAKGAVVDARDKDGVSPLLPAAQKGYAEIVDALLARGADANAKSDDGLTPLLLAAQNGHAEVVNALLTNGADIEAKNDEGLTPLLLAAQNGHTEIVSALLAAGADVNAESNDGRTALTFAESQGYEHIALLLEEAGAE